MNKLINHQLLKIRKDTLKNDTFKKYLAIKWELDKYDPHNLSIGQKILLGKVNDFLYENLMAEIENDFNVENNTKIISHLLSNYKANELGRYFYIDLPHKDLIKMSFLGLLNYLEDKQDAINSILFWAYYKAFNSADINTVLDTHKQTFECEYCALVLNTDGIHGCAFCCCDDCMDDLLDSYNYHALPNGDGLDPIYHDYLNDFFEEDDE